MLRRPCTGYTNGDRLGKGTYGTVQRVVSGTGHIYARKSQKNITLIELQACKLNHPNIITCHDIQFNCDNSPVSLYLSPVGKALDEYIQKTPLDYKTKLSFIGDIVDGLAHLHYNNILHLDMKLDNIIVNDGRAVIIDFGLSVYGKSRLTMINGYSRISNWYRDPVIDYELITSGKEIYSRKSDLYSLGLIILLILVNGKFKLYKDDVTDESYIYVKNVERMLEVSGVPDYIQWNQLIKQLLNNELDTFDLVNHPLLHYHKFQARKMGEIQYPIANQESSYINNLIQDALDTISEKKIGYLPYYVLAYFIKLCLLGPDVPSFEFVCSVYYDKFNTENQEVVKYFDKKITLIESLDDCVDFHRLILAGNHEQALDIQPKDVILSKVASINDVLEKIKSQETSSL